ncbi:hypothetical protein C0995_009353 [Termitomyces sp. Mi166|nr:hypothetical protein C0995_009353 [Termitomyces sp. Mi166\
MASNLTEIQAQQLNPLTPMAFLNPDAGYQATIAAHKIGIPTVVYFLSRSAAALSDCQVIEKTICVIYHVAFSSTSLLFFLRVRAVFNQNKAIVAFFAILWLGVLGASLAVATVGNAVHLGPTRYCINTKLKAYASAAPITFAINDTFVFLAISWRLLSNGNLGRGHESSIKSIMLGEYLPAFSRAVFQDGQVYYLVSVTSNIVAAVITWAGDVPLPYRLMFIIFTVALTNMMACRVFRHTKFGDFREDTISSRWLASQLGHLDLEAGKGHAKSSLRFVSFRATENETDESDGDWRERALRKTNTVITGTKVTDSAPMEKADPRGKDTHVAAA